MKGSKRTAKGKGQRRKKSVGVGPKRGRRQCDGEGQGGVGDIREVRRMSNDYGNCARRWVKLGWGRRVKTAKRWWLEKDDVETESGGRCLWCSDEPKIGELTKTQACWTVVGKGPCRVCK